MRRIFSVFRSANYRVYISGSSINLIGSWMQRIAVGWLAWELTGSGGWLGLVAFADLFPSVFVGPIGGAVADRFDRIRVIAVAQTLAMIQATTLFVLTAAGQITIEWLLVLVLMNGIVMGFNQPSRLALIPSLVPREDLSTAVAINAIVFNLARFIGPAAAGLIIVTSGVAAAFAANALTFPFFLLALWRLRLPAVANAKARATVAGIWADIREGLAYVAGHAGIGPLLVLLVMMSIMVRPFVELLPGFTDQVFARGAEGLAILSSTIGVGAILGGVWMANRSGGNQGLTRLALGSAVVVALAILGFAATDNFAVAVACVAISGCAMVGAGVASQVLLQSAVDPAMRGRVMSLYGIIFRGGPAAGALVIGLASEWVGLRWPLAMGCLGALAACAWAWGRYGVLRRELEAEAPA